MLNPARSAPLPCAETMQLTSARLVRLHHNFSHGLRSRNYVYSRTWTVRNLRSSRLIPLTLRTSPPADTCRDYGPSSYDHHGASRFRMWSPRATHSAREQGCGCVQVLTVTGLSPGRLTAPRCLRRLHHHRCRHERVTAAPPMIVNRVRARSDRFRHRRALRRRHPGVNTISRPANSDGSVNKVDQAPSASSFTWPPDWFLKRWP